MTLYYDDSLQEILDLMTPAEKKKEEEVDPASVCKYRLMKKIAEKSVDKFTYDDGSLYLTPKYTQTSKEEKEFERECLRTLRAIPLCHVSGMPTEIAVMPSYDYDNRHGILEAYLMCRHCKK